MNIYKNIKALIKLQITKNASLLVFSNSQFRLNLELLLFDIVATKLISVRWYGSEEGKIVCQTKVEIQTILTTYKVPYQQPNTILMISIYY